MSDYEGVITVEEMRSVLDGLREEAYRLARKIETSELFYDTIPPQALDTEQAVLGALLIAGGEDWAGKGAAATLEVINPLDFYRPAHSQIAACLQALYIEGAPCDLIAVQEWLRAYGILEEVGGSPCIVELTDHACLQANLPYHCSVLRERAHCREVIRCAVRTIRLCQRPDVPHHDKIRRIRAAFGGVLNK